MNNDLNDQLKNELDKKIDKEIKNFDKDIAFGNINSKKITKPWDLLDKDINNYDFKTEDSENNKKTEIHDSGLVLLFSKTIDLITQNSKFFLKTFFTMVFLGLLAAFLIPSSYYSTLHLFAPEFSDTIGTRLSLFTQRIEYASFPVDYRTPVSILSRRLREDVAKDWVLNKIKTNPELSKKMNGLIDSSVSVETNYVPIQQLLQIDGYANTPEMAVEISKLYHQYLLESISKIELAQSEKVRMWFDLTNKSVDEQMDIVSNQIKAITPQTNGKVSTLKLKDLLGDSYSTSEIKKTELLKTVTELKKLGAMTSYENITESSEPAVEMQLRIYNQLLIRQQFVDGSQMQDAVLALRQVINQKTQEAENSLNNLTIDQSSTIRQIAEVGSKDGDLRMINDQEGDLRSQLAALRMQKVELTKLKSQVEMENGIRTATYKTIKEPLPNYSSIRPLPAIKYSIVLVLAVMLSILIVYFYGLYIKQKKISF